MENLATIDIIRSKVSDFKEIAEMFSSLLTEENQALNDYNLQAVGDLYESKNQLVTAYRNLVAFFIKNQEGLKTLEDTERKGLKELSLNLEALLKKNDMLLRTKMDTSKMIMDSIIGMAKMSNNANSTSYGAQGKYAPLDNNSNALAINRTL